MGTRRRVCYNSIAGVAIGPARRLCGMRRFVCIGMAAAGVTAHAEASGPALARVAGAPPDEAFLCVLPQHAPTPRAMHAPTRLVTIDEAEPNGSAGQAALLPLSEAEPAVDLLGTIGFSGDEDLFAVEVEAGQWLNIATTDTTAVNAALGVLRVGAGGALETEVVNDDNRGQTDVYPAASPLLRTGDFQSVLTWIAPESGTWLIRVAGRFSSSTGSYRAQVRLVGGGVETMAPGERQIIFVDFDGATINPAATFGVGVPANVQLSPMADFLPAWGLSDTQSNRDAVIDGVMAGMTQAFEAARMFIPDLDYELRNSRDDADPWGQPNVSRVIIGGTRAETGIQAIGIAETVDPGNYERAETAVVLLDVLSDPAFAVACQNQALAGGATLTDAITRALGAIAAHEAGHYLGAWHTENDNEIACIIDEGGDNHERNIYSAGDDGVIGSADDMTAAFVRDAYPDPARVIALVGSFENVGWRIASALRAPAACPADLNADGVVDGVDLGALLGAWGAAGPTDLNGDGVTDGADLGVLLGAWGAC